MSTRSTVTRAPAPTPMEDHQVPATSGGCATSIRPKGTRASTNTSRCQSKGARAQQSTSRGSGASSMRSWGYPHERMAIVLLIGLWPWPRLGSPPHSRERLPHPAEVRRRSRRGGIRDPCGRRCRGRTHRPRRRPRRPCARLRPKRRAAPSKRRVLQAVRPPLRRRRRVLGPSRNCPRHHRVAGDIQLKKRGS